MTILKATILLGLFLVVDGYKPSDGGKTIAKLEDQLDSYCDSKSKGAGGVGSSDPVNYRAIQEYVDEYVTNHTLLVNMRVVDALVKFKAEMKRVTMCNGIFYDFTCYRLHITRRGKLEIDYDVAHALCKHYGTTLADIQSKTHYNSVVSHVRAQRLDSSLPFINFWTAMKRDMPSGKVYLSDGSLAPYVGEVRNSREWSTTDPREPYVYVSVWTDGLSHDSNPGGFGNTHASQQWNAVLCQYPVSVERKA